VTLYEFNALSETDQGIALWDRGVHLTERSDHIFTYVLYQLDNFYVEVWYHRDFNAIQRFRPFNSMTALQPYLKNIDIASILNDS
jgi:hypothetical protein